MKRFLSITLILYLLTGCNSTDKSVEKSLRLYVDLDVPSTPLNELFDSIKVIPLETNDNSLIVYPVQINIYNDTICLFDNHTKTISIFSLNGKFIRTIGNKGNGPGEYTYISGYSINKNNGNIRLLSFHNYLEFTSKGQYIQDKRLPPENSNYQSLFDLNGKLVSSTIPKDSKEYCISIINPRTIEIDTQFVKGSKIIKTISNELYQYDNKVYYAQTLENQNVYEIGKDTLKPAYHWDFGKRNFFANQLDLSYEDENINNEHQRMHNYLADGTIPYWIVRQGQNKDYYYAHLREHPYIGRSIFYRKKDGRYFIIGKEKEDVQIPHTIFLADEYLVYPIYYRDYLKYKTILPESEYKKLEALTEDDNPCLLKLYFKK